jgi:hypothetical protein
MGNIRAFKERASEHRFWVKLPERPESGCWFWSGYLDKDGYGIYGTGSKYGTTRAHRIAYTFLVGPIPEGLTLDHLCRNRSCCNPAHLEPVTTQVNTHRCMRTQRDCCVNGHPYTEENIRIDSRGHRVCRECHKNVYYQPKGRPAPTHCKHGHEFSIENTRVSPTTGERVCRTCCRERMQVKRTKALIS